MKKRFTLVALIALVIAIPTLVFSGDELHKAAYNGELDKVQTILKNKVDFDERDSFGGTALHAAMFQDNMQIVELLIKAGHDINVQGTYNKYTPLHDAVWANNLKAAKILIKHGAKTNIKGRDGFTPYEKAVDENKTEMANYLRTLQ